MKNKKMKLLKIYIVIIFLTTIVFFSFIAVIKNYFIYSKAKEKYDITQNSIQNEENKKQSIENDLEKIEIPSEAEKQLLDKYMLKRPGERVIELID